MEQDELDDVQRGRGPGNQQVDFSTLTLGLRQCPRCGRHGEVLVMQGEVILQTISVTSREEARQVNADLVERGGNNQADFLASVEGAHYLREDVVVITVGVMVVDFGGTAEDPAPDPTADLRRFLSQEADLTQAVLTLHRCPCGEHGVVVLTLKDGQQMEVGLPQTKEEACLELERLMFRSRQFPDQPEYVEAVRQAEWLPGPMPVEL